MEKEEPISFRSETHFNYLERWSKRKKSTSEQNIMSRMSKKGFLPQSSSFEFTCDQCDYKGTHKGNLLRHIKSRHEGLKFSCDQCDYNATQKGDLLRHKKSKHEDQ